MRVKVKLQIWLKTRVKIMFKFKDWLKVSFKFMMGVWIGLGLEVDMKLGFRFEREFD